MIYGGFELSTPNVPTDSIYKVSLLKMFESSPSLVSKLKAIDTNNNESMSSSNQSLASKNMEESSGMMRGQTTPNIKSSEGQRSKDEIKPVSEKKKRMKLLEPVLGGEKSKAPAVEIKKKMNSKMDIASYFLDMLLQPAVYMNA
jgi:hypothetical protein